MARSVPPGGGRRLQRRSLPTAFPAALPPDSTRPSVSVVIVNFCQWRNTARLTRQLRRCHLLRSGDAEVVIVDNHSPSHPVVQKLRRMSGVVVRRFSRNHGFARAVNRACDTARGDWVLLLNPDVTVGEGFLDEAFAAAERIAAAQPKAGVIGFSLRNPDGSPQASAGSFPTLWGTLGRLFHRRSRRKYDPLPQGEPCRVAWATGGCLLVKRECFEQIGGLDERFFLYYEDVDFCLRAAAKGWSVWYEPSVQVTHHWPLHARRVPAPLRLMTRHALLTYARAHWPGWQLRLMSRLVWTDALLRRLWAAVRGDADASRLYGQLQALVGDLRHSRFDSARRRVRFAAAFLDPIAAEQDGRTE